MARGESISKPTNLSLEQREQIFDKTVAQVTKYYFDPNFNGTEWPKRASETRDAILSASDPDPQKQPYRILPSVRAAGSRQAGDWS